MRLELSYLSNFCDKRPDQSNIGKEEVIGAHYLRCTASQCRRHGGRVWTTGQSTFPLKEQRDMNTGIPSCSLFIQCRTLASRAESPTLRYFFSLYLNPSACHRNHKKFVFQITLNPIKLAIKIDSHTGLMIQLPIRVLSVNVTAPGDRYSMLMSLWEGAFYLQKLIVPRLSWVPVN